MGKGKLKTALKNQKAVEDFQKQNDKKVKKPVKPVLQDPEEEVESSESEEELDLSQLPDKDAPLSKKEKRKLKKLIAKAKEANGEEEDDEESGDEDELDLEKLAASESESDINDDEDDSESDDDEEAENDEDAEDDEEDEEAEDIPLSDAELDSDADVVPHSKLTINNIAALKDSLARIVLPWEKHSFIEHQSVVSAEKAELGIKDIYDDTERELAFYRQGLDAVKQGRATLLKLKVPFSRPLDYFAEMVKSDEHMDKLKGKLLKEAADKKASEDAKKQRALKKFGKKVQHETLQERAKQKRETLDKIKSLKKKRGANEISNDADFQIALEEATSEDRPKRAKPNGKRLAKDAKYGQGGQKRGSRRNDADSSADIYNQRGKKGKSTRPGKSKRSRN
ncbi:hypothetical protein JCM33374_g2583 [Metschnikowia sp. JCM 33374]|nr:hypothetical protein JCM33374_g2583 [Metschnikowia sp. JCM 33374]